MIEPYEAQQILDEDTTDSNIEAMRFICEHHPHFRLLDKQGQIRDLTDVWETRGIKGLSSTHKAAQHAKRIKDRMQEAFDEIDRLQRFYRTFYREE